MKGAAADAAAADAAAAAEAAFAYRIQANDGLRRMLQGERTMILDFPI